jgi:CRP-like cAMP-binding protein
MPFSKNNNNCCKNRLLALLPQPDYLQLLPQLEPVQLAAKQLLFERNQTVRYVYFPCTAMISIVALMEDGSALEVGNIGNEGMAGLSSFLGSKMATATAVCQIPGKAYRLRTQDLADLTREHTPLRKVIQAYTVAFMGQLSQSVACNRLHSVEQRFARWMLMTQDRVGEQAFNLTQEFIAQMLGVHRPTVSLVASTFQRAGLIEYKRGQMTILNRPGLEKASCECYRIAKDQYDRLLAPGKPLA